MTTPQRRSSRLSGTNTPSHTKSTPVINKLSSLVERDESPDGDCPNIDALVSSPVAPNTASNLPPSSNMPSLLKTPQTVSRIMPSWEEMHPSKVQSSTKKPQNPWPLNSHPSSTLSRSPSKIAVAVGTHRSPNKKDNSPSVKMTSPSFDFSFERPDSDLSAEAQKIMKSVREEAEKMKAQMVQQRDKQGKDDREADRLFSIGGRQIRKPKGQSGRFSDVHRQEFKKMDSIVNHASTWKNKFQAATPASLKRSPSKAGLDEVKSLSRSKSFNQLESGSGDRLDNTSPSKRTKTAIEEDVSMIRPVSRDTVSSSPQMTPTKLRSLGGLPRAITTPTKASLARSASVKSLKTSMIPPLAKSASTWTLASPVAPKTEGSKKRLGSWQKLGGNMKSILHRAQPRFSNDPTKVAAGTHLPVPQREPGIDKDLPSLLDTSTIKRVDFTSSTKSRHDLASTNQSSSPSKIPTLQSKQLQSQEPPSPVCTPQEAEPISYPDLTASPMITTRAKSPKVNLTLTPVEHAADGPSDFTFCTNKTITFGSKSPTSFTSPNGTSTIRQVRPSGVPTSVMPGAYTSELSMAVPAIQHGISNKKRKLASSDDENDEDMENVDPAASAGINATKGEDEAPKAKKQRIIGPLGNSPAKGEKENIAKRRVFGPAGKGTKKTGLSLSRLNMLARPKERR